MAGLKIARNAPDRFSRLVAVELSAGWHPGFYKYRAISGLIPLTGFSAFHKLRRNFNNILMVGWEYF